MGRSEWRLHIADILEIAWSNTGSFLSEKKEGKLQNSSGVVPLRLQTDVLVYQIWLKTLHNAPKYTTCYLDVACHKYV